MYHHGPKKERKTQKEGTKLFKREEKRLLQSVRVILLY